MTKRIKIALFLFVLLTSASKLHAQDALVTFYMHGSNLKSGLPGTKSGIYFGPVYDGTERLFTFQTGFIQKTNRFITMSFPPGLHTFSAHYGKNAGPGSTVSITLEPGKHYFLSAKSGSRGVVVVEFERGLLQQVGCEAARTETAGGKPVELKRVSKPLIGRVVSEASFPNCSSISVRN